MLADGRNAIHLPPHDADMERSVLACVMLEGETLNEIQQLLSAEDFYVPAHKTIYRTALELYRAGSPVDALTVAEQLDAKGALDGVGGAPAITAILETVPHAAHAAYYAEKVREKSHRRRLIEAACEAIREAQDGSRPITEIVTRAESRLHSIIEDDAGNGPVEISEAVLEMYARWEAGDVPGLPTGWSDLDRLLNGGLRPGSLTIVAARPSVGKTAAAGNMALAVAKRRASVLFVSLEQSCAELVERLLSSISDIGAARIKKQDVTEEELEQLRGFGEELGSLPLAIDDRGTLTVGQIAAVARLRRRRYGLDLLIVDYLQQLAPEDPKAAREQQVAAMSRALKCLARELNIPVVCLAQLNRGLEAREDKQPRLSDLRESGALEQDADAVLFLHRPYMYDKRADPSDARLLVAKNRHGMTGEISLYWHPELMTFRSVARIFERQAS